MTRTVAGKSVLGLAVAALVLSGCQANKKDIGMIVGAGAGALIGAQFGGGAGKILAIVGGAVAGAWLGGQLGKYLDEQDQKRLAESTQRTAVTGQSQTWKNPETGVSGRTRVVDTETKEQSYNVAYRTDRIKEVPPIDYIGERFVSSGSMNVRGGPGTDYAVVGKLAKGESVEVVGKVEGKNWYLLSQDGIGQGYGYAPLLQRTGDEINLAGDSAASQPNVAVSQVRNSQTCRTIEQTIVLKDGSEKTEKVKACKGPDGWEIT
ncbi:MAG: SH3 domain-containing protein [Hyphomicrobiales bacterium]|nr:SH3 domain-containing protein [Hyphomicrobiales bacterium]MCP5372568.1 SH3 domain-containing protein [Hyphomicrobiales bacterium]